MATLEEKREEELQRRAKELCGKGFRITDAELRELRMIDPLASHDLESHLFHTSTIPLTKEQKKEIKRRENLIKSNLDPKTTENLKMDLAHYKSDLRSRGYDA